jgi:hypothetical protein
MYCHLNNLKQPQTYHLAQVLCLGVYSKFQVFKLQVHHAQLHTIYKSHLMQWLSSSFASPKHLSSDVMSVDRLKYSSWDIVCHHTKTVMLVWLNGCVCIFASFTMRLPVQFLNLQAFFSSCLSAS